MSLLNTEVNEVCNYLRGKSINIPRNNSWLTSCVECFKGQENYNLKQLKDLVYEQWLLADLADIGVQSIPSDCLSLEKSILEGKYPVQLNSFVNVAVSFHKQLQKIRRPDVLSNLEVDFEATQENKKEPTGNRILKIELTDGVVTIVAFEDQYIPSLQQPFVPGKKAILIGPVECRKSIFFLKPRNIVLLGGEVDALHVPNATENILARSLNLPQNADPYSQKVSSLSQEVSANLVDDKWLDDDEEYLLAQVLENEESKVQTHSASQNSFSSSNISAYVTQTNTVSRPVLSNSNAALHASVASKHNMRSVAQNVFTISNEDFDDDFDLLAAETAAEAEKERLNSGSNSIDNVASTLKAYNVFDSSTIKKDLQEITDLRENLTKSYGSEASLQIIDPINTGDNRKIADISIQSGLSADIDISDFSQNSIEEELNEPCDIPFYSEPFPPRKRPATITAFSRVVKVLKKPKLKDDKWSVDALVEARGIEIEVTFESRVIDKIFTVTAAEIVSKRKALTTDPLMKQQMNEVLKQSQMKFSKLACDMTFNFRDAISNPIVIDVKTER